MSLLSSTSRRDEEETPSGPIGALLIAIPISLLLWSGVMFILFQFIH